MPQCGLHQMNRSAPAERVRSVGVPKPVAAHLGRNPSPLARLSRDTRDARPYASHMRRGVPLLPIDVAHFDTAGSAT